MRSVNMSAPETEDVLNNSPLERVIERATRVLGSWNKTTTVEQMRNDWDELYWSDATPAQLESLSANGVSAAWVDAPGVAAGKVLLYFHGGGYQVGSLRSHRELMARLSLAAGCRVLYFDYRLAPEYRFPAPIEDAVSVYRWLLNQGFPSTSIVFVGDSGGGGLALSTLLALRDQGLPLPAAMAAMSLWADLTGSGDSYVERAAADPINHRRKILAMAKFYLDDADPCDPLASPLFADLHGLPPMLLQVGARETVFDDSRVFATKARESGIDVELQVWDEMIHVFQLFAADLAEARDAIAAIGGFLQKHLGARINH